jgi:phosphate starvation-inducible protein PhoH
LTRSNCGNCICKFGRREPEHPTHVKKIALPQEGIATLYGAHDGNLKHIESLLGVEIRTQGDELIVEGEKAAEQRVERIFDQLKSLMAEGYELRNGDVKTAAQLIADDSAVNLRDYFLKEGQKQPEGTKRRVNPKSTNQRRYLEPSRSSTSSLASGPLAPARPTWRWRRPSAISWPRKSAASFWPGPPWRRGRS